MANSTHPELLGSNIAQPTMETLTLMTTSKRRRDQANRVSSIDATQFMSNPHTAAEDGTDSLRCWRVVLQFHGLDLGDKDGVAGPGGTINENRQDAATKPKPNSIDAVMADASARKRTKLNVSETIESDMTDAQFVERAADAGDPAAPSVMDLGLRPEPNLTAVRMANDDTKHTEVYVHDNLLVTQRSATSPHMRRKAADFQDPTNPNPISSAFQRSRSATHRESNNRGKRNGTPPSTRRANANVVRKSPCPRRVTDPIRAALTWQDDETTVYDPDDSGDDGEGINGLGFKPTAAEANRRSFKRKQQLAEYRKREEREARGRQNQRRHADVVPAVASSTRLAAKKERRRVHFEVFIAAQMIGPS